MQQVVPEAGGKIVGRCRVHADRKAQALLAQVVQQVDQLASFLLPSGGTDGSAHSPSAVLVLGEMNLAEILKINSLTGHIKGHVKDHASRRGLLMLVSRRRRLLDYLKRVDPDSYQTILEKLELRK